MKVLIYTIGVLIFIAWFFGFFENKSKTWIKHPQTPYTFIVRETIRFCGGILYKNGVKYYPHFKICYYRNKKYAGLFNNSKVVIYLKNNPDIPTLVNSVLHEVKHYMQSETDRQFKRYDEYTRKLSYMNNPFEVEARAFADQHLAEALKYLESKKMIVRRKI